MHWISGHFPWSPAGEFSGSGKRIQSKPVILGSRYLPNPRRSRPGSSADRLAPDLIALHVPFGGIRGPVPFSRTGSRLRGMNRDQISGHMAAISVISARIPEETENRGTAIETLGKSAAGKNLPPGTVMVNRDRASKRGYESWDDGLGTIGSLFVVRPAHIKDLDVIIRHSKDTPCSAFGECGLYTLSSFRTKGTDFPSNPFGCHPDNSHPLHYWVCLWRGRFCCRLCPPGHPDHGRFPWRWDLCPYRGTQGSPRFRNRYTTQIDLSPFR